MALERVRKEERVRKVKFNVVLGRRPFLEKEEGHGFITTGERVPGSLQQASQTSKERLFKERQPSLNPSPHGTSARPFSFLLQVAIELLSLPLSNKG